MYNVNSSSCMSVDANSNENNGSCDVINKENINISTSFDMIFMLLWYYGHFRLSWHVGFWAV